jgi:DNA-binding LytR/AlgR family response regulator
MIKKRFGLHIAYWIVILLFLILFFGYRWANFSLAFYFSSMLLPIVMGTSYFFNRYLVPRYLLRGKYGYFALYFFYMLVVSLYLEMLVALFSFALLANYRIDVMDLRTMSIFILGVNLYLIVFVTSFIRIALQFRQKVQQVHELSAEIKKKEKASIVIRADRKNHQIPIDELLYIESLGDYVKVVTISLELSVREKISKLHGRMPADFIRIHRSFAVNKAQVQSFTKTEVRLKSGITLPIGRTYKEEAVEALSAKESSQLD